jgi:uncharacterized repeat protein (TIGR01451 family)
MATTDIINKASGTVNGESVNSNIVTILAKVLPVVIVKSTTFVGEWKSKDTITWKIVCTNPNTVQPLNNILFTDVLDVKTTYVVGSFKINNITTTPVSTTPALTHTITTIPALGSVTIEFNVLCV